MIYLWKIPEEYPEEFIGRYARNESPDRILFLKGDSIPGGIPLPKIIFDVSCDQLVEFDILPNSAMIPLVSERVAEVLLQLCPTDVQFVEAQIIANQKELQGYKLLNATQTVNCLDHNNSDYSFIPGTDAIMGFKKLRLVPGCFSGRQLARESEYKSYLYVSKRIKDIFDERGWKGHAFLPPESIHP